jgi:uncharacterized membrane protein
VSGLCEEPETLIAQVILAMPLVVNHHLDSNWMTGAMDKQLAGYSIVMTIIWVSVVLAVIYWMS